MKAEEVGKRCFVWRKIKYLGGVILFTFGIVEEYLFVFSF